MSARFTVNHAELDALSGLPFAARVAYMEGIKPYMDFATGIVGAAGRPGKSISLQSLTEVLFVEPKQGRTGTGSRSRKQARICIDVLINAGLIESMSVSTKNDKRLILKCLLADTDESVQIKQGTNRAHYQGTNRAQSDTRDSNGLDASETPKQGTPETPKQGTPPKSYNYKHTITRARILEPIPGDFSLDDSVVAYLAMTPVPLEFCKGLVDEFRLANTANGYQSLNWPAEFAKYCVKQWRYQQSFENRNKSPGSGKRIHSPHHDIDTDKDYLDGADGFVTRRH